MISVTILVKNGERRLREVLESLKKFNEIILLDTGSTDRTLLIAAEFPNVKMYQRSFQGFGHAHNEAASLANNEWILSIDADEVLSEDLAKEILNYSLDAGCVYALSFYNYFNGKHIKWCGWYPESHVRLYHKNTTRFSEALVHEGVLCDGLRKKYFKAPLHHYSYDTLSDFLQKMERYSTLFALQYHRKRASSPLIALYHGVGAFLKSYLLKRGFLGGYEGFLISVYNGHTAFYKYLKLYEINATHSDVSSDRDGQIR